jgi:2'-5' RNA ligase
MNRLFVAIDLPERHRMELVALAGGIPGARWVPPENIHLTLRFIGNVGGDQMTDIDHSLAQVRAPGFDIVIQGVEHFRRGRKPSTLWAGIAKNPALMTLQDKIEAALVRAGVAPDGRKFTPHVTLARLKDAPRGRVHDMIARNGLMRLPPFPATSFTLFSSFLARSGAIHRVEATYPLETAEVTP